MDNPTETLAALNALCSENPWDVSILSNASAFLFESFGQINWTGFYLVRNGELLLGPFAGKPACTSIRPGCGVCGTALKENKTFNVPDVHLFPGHIACDSASNSELVIPLAVNGNIKSGYDADALREELVTLLIKVTNKKTKGTEEDTNER